MASSPDHLRVASIQYLMRPVRAFEQFQEQVAALVETAEDYRARLVVFPEYFSAQLLTLGDTKAPMKQQVRKLASQAPRVLEILRDLAVQYKIYICGGTVPVHDEQTDRVYNECHFFAPNGESGVQGKLHMTRFEREEWIVSPSSQFRVFETEFGLVAIAICYDCEFPEIVRAAARKGCHLLLVPSCTDDRQGYLRVRYCAQARAIENQMYVVHSCTVGSLPAVPAVSLNYGAASILTPSDFAFSRDGILAEGNENQEMMVIGDMNLRTIADSRSKGTVLPLLDSERSQEIAGGLEIVRL